MDVAEPIDFYFEFASPYGYLASTQIDALAARHGRGVRWHPIMLGAALKATGSRPLVEIPYMMRDLPRFARLLGVPFTAPPRMPGNSLHASRAAVWLEEREGQDAAKALAKAILQAHWGDGRDIGTPELVADIAAPLGVEPAALLAAVTDPAIKQKLKERTEASLDRGVFGSPFIFIDGEPFWGADRLDQVERRLENGGW
jgi:2-hydroxychromene-2-carboxylate isomerase